MQCKPFPWSRYLPYNNRYITITLCPPFLCPCPFQTVVLQGQPLPALIFLIGPLLSDMDLILTLKDPWSAGPWLTFSAEHGGGWGVMLPHFQ